jgi:hypothetical protein
MAKTSQKQHPPGDHIEETSAPDNTAATEARYEQVDPTGPAVATTAASERNTSTFFAELESLRLSEDETQGPGVGREILIRVPLRRPRRKDFIRVHPDSAMTAALSLFVDDGEDGDGEAYAVTKEMRELFGDDVAPTLLQLAIFRTGTVFIWPLRIPQVDGGRGRSWHESAYIARDIAKTQWIKVLSDRSLGGYRVFPAQGPIPEPKWPELSIEELLEIALRDKIIKSADHPMARKYQGR